MKGQTSTGAIVSIIVIALIIIFGAWWFFTSPAQGPQPSASEEQQVQFAVASFGSQLKMVPLSSASSTIIIDAIDQYYAPYVAPELLVQWAGAPTSTPGRLTSSPWPDRIDILSTTQNSDGSYTVRGNVVEITSADMANDTVTSTYPVKITLEKRFNQWLITGFRRTDGVQVQHP